MLRINENIEGKLNCIKEENLFIMSEMSCWVITESITIKIDKLKFLFHIKERVYVIQTLTFIRGFFRFAI